MNAKTINKHQYRGAYVANNTNNQDTISLWFAILPLISLIIMLTSSVLLFGDSSSSGPNQLALMFSAGVGIALGMVRGQSYEVLEQALVDGIMLAMKACLILLMVGSMIGSWMLAGTAPAVIHLGLGVLDPGFLYPAALIICALVAASIGSSWTTAATVGLALIGISRILGLSPEITAGAVISGAYFGDKMSPLSDTTNLAPAMVDVDLFVHIRHMVWTTTPSLLISLALFTWLGWGIEIGDGTVSSIETTRSLLENSYNLGFPAFIPLIVLLALALRKVPALPTITIGALVGCVVAVLYQPDATLAFGGGLADGVSQTGVTIKALWMAMVDGYTADTGNDMLNDLLSRGGMSSMLTTVWLIISAMCFGGVMEKTGFLGRIVTGALKGVRGTGSLVLTTVLTSIGMNIVAGDQYIAIALPGRMYMMEFKRRGLAPQNLSRTLEDAGTMTSALIPWNTCGAFMAGTLGVATFAYAPYAFFNLLNPIIAVIYGFFNIKITKMSDEQQPEVKVEKA
ncbi:Na+/H+ antiporter NhaC [Kordiimonas aestuarii]|uniref:Na+/H+ antiporter NhaC n=1 Tax=Kordiimonas aestuarii TaxID=1005925 RepID=UPI0021D34CCA|nr:Na+/H+ antiporter NhaC [Kordiimonas aestuarii]